MNPFREAFRRAFEEATENLPVPPMFQKKKDHDLVIVPKQNANGFEVCLQCFDYGVYPSADGWHGGPWDVTVWKPIELSTSIAEFIASVTSDAVLHVHYSNEKPFKWVLHHQFEGKRIFDETGMIFFNWFGKRTQKTFCNGKQKT